MNRELVGTLGNFIYRILLFRDKNFGHIPDTPVDAAIIQQIAATRTKMVKALEEYEFKKFVDAAMSLSDFGNVYFQSKALWKLVKSDKKACAREVKNCIQLVKALAVLFEPVMPSTMKELQAQLGVTSTQFSDATIEVEPLRLNQPDLPFAKIDEKKIVELEATLTRRMTGLVQHAPANEVRTKTSTIELEDFKKMDLRTAHILDAESVKKSNKLLRITLQLAMNAEVVAGIDRDYRAEALIGTDVIVLANVTPVKLMGVEFMGMLLAAEHEGRAGHIRPSQKVPSGTKIK